MCGECNQTDSCWGPPVRVLLRGSHRLQLELLFLTRRAAVATAIAVFGALGACGGGGDDRDSELSNVNEGVPCVDDAPGKDATYANSDVAIGRDPRKPVGEARKAYRSGRELPWFAKTPLFVRGDREVVVRVPGELTDVVRISGWGTNDRKGHEAVLVEPTTSCPEDWTAYPGGLIFRGRQCVRLMVEGPGDARGSVLVGLRKDCSA